MKIKVLSLIVCYLVLFNSCKEGCTDENALNYDLKAKKPDNSCEYKGRVIFWNYYSGSESVFDCGTISVSVENENIGEIIGFWALSDSIPECSVYDDTSSLRRERIVFKVLNPGEYSYSANDNCKSWTGTFVIESNECKMVQLGYDLYVSP